MSIHPVDTYVYTNLVGMSVHGLLILLASLPGNPAIVRCLFDSEEGEVSGNLVLVHVDTSDHAHSPDPGVYPPTLTGSDLKHHQRIVLREIRREGGMREEGCVCVCVCVCVFDSQLLRFLWVSICTCVSE